MALKNTTSLLESNRGKRGKQHVKAVKEAKASEPTANRLYFSLWLQFDSYSHKNHHQPQYTVVFMFCLFPWLFDYIKEIRQVFWFALSSVCAECHIAVPHYKEISHPPVCSSPPPSPLVTANFQFCCNALDSGMFRSPSARSCSVWGSTEAQFWRAASGRTERNNFCCVFQGNGAFRSEKSACPGFDAPKSLSKLTPRRRVHVCQASP